MAAGTLGYKAAEANLVLAAMFRTAGFAAYSGPAGGYYIMLHTGEPGPTGLTAAANSSRRVALGACDVPAAGQTSNSAQITFSAVTGSGLQTYTHYSMWDHATSTSIGNFKFDGTLTGTANPGQDFIINAGGLVFDLNIDD